MSVWFCLPSKRPPEESEPVFAKWREMGYKIAILTDDQVKRNVDLQIYSLEYGGYARSVNELRAHIIGGELDSYNISPNGEKVPAVLRYDQPFDPECEWLVCGGDDVLPDQNHTAEKIAAECRWNFTERHMNRCESVPDDDPPSWIAFSRSMAVKQMQTFGVMQPTGDRWGIDPNSHAFVSRTAGCDSCACQVCGRGEIAPVHLTGAYIDRVAGSPWIGREFARRAYQGKGPYWPEYTHMGVDEEMQAVATKLGVFWQRLDLTHFHQHWGRPKPGETMGQADRMPAFLAKANSPEEWKRYKRIFAERQAEGFPGHESI